MMRLWIVILFLPIAFFQTPTPTTPLSTNPDIVVDINRLLQTPVLYNMDTPALKDIFQHGQQLGNHPDAFSKIGDSNTATPAFLEPLGREGQYNLGQYSDLQPTVDFFSTLYGDSNSFTRDSAAARNGLSSSSILDPMWAGEACQPGETPVACEYRLQMPSVAIVMIGMIDTHSIVDMDLYRDNLEDVIETSINQGVIPVLTTIIVLPDIQPGFDESMQMDSILLDLADQYQIPVINLWSAVQSLPDYGIGPDHTHLKQKVGAYCDFTGTEQEIGGTLRNLLTLQALDALRQNVIQAPPQT